MDTKTAERIDPGATLTRHQWEGLRRDFNLADGHSRQSQSQEQLAFLQDLPALFRDCIDADQEVEEAQFTDAFFEMAGQSSISALPPPSFHYSASVSIAIAAAHLRALGGVVLVVHPTFDNIPALLSRHGVPIRPISFRDVNDLTTFPSDVKALVLVIPNNPTGESMNARQLDRIARACANQQVELVIDFSFRFASNLCDWDQYAVLQGSEVRFLCIEDTGKTWPVLDLKVGLVISSTAIISSVRAITEDYILNVSPFLLRLLTEYIKSDPKRSWRAIAHANKESLIAALEGSRASVRGGGAAETIAWVDLGEGSDSDEFCRWANGSGVAVCPGGPFYWDQPEIGQEFIRVALLRPREYFENAVRQLRMLIDSYASGTSLRLQAANMSQADA